MRAMLRTVPVLVATALLVLAPAISPGGGLVPKGDFTVNPDTIFADTPSAVNVSGADCRDQLLLISTEIPVQLRADTPTGTLLDSYTAPNDSSGDWALSTLVLDLPEGDYWFLAACQHEEQPPVADCDSADAGMPPEPNFGPGCYNAQLLRVVEQEAGPAQAEQEEPTFTG